MDEQSSSDDASIVRGSLVDSRRLLFEKYVTEQANRPESADEAAAVIRQNGRQLRSVRAGKVNSFREELVPSNRIDGRQLSSNHSAEAPVVRRRSQNDEDFVTDTRQAADERVSSVPSPAASAHQAPPSLPTLPASQTGAPSVAASETSPPSGESVSHVPHNECHSPDGSHLSAGSGSPVPAFLCQSSADASPPNCSKRISYHHAVLNGAKVKLAGRSSPPDTVLETSCSNSSPSDGEGGTDHSNNLNLPDTLCLSTCESSSFIATDAASNRSSPVEDFSASACTNSCHSSLNPSSRETCEPVVVVTTSDEPVPIDDGKEPVPTDNNHEITPVAESDGISRSADSDKTTFSVITGSFVESAASNPSAVPVVASKPPTKPAIGSKPVRSVIKNKPIHSPSSVGVAAAITTNYPEDLNPFGDDDDNKNDASEKPPQMNLVAADSEHDSTNPFGSDSDDDDPNISKSPAASTNPFWSGSEEEEEGEDDKASASRTPVPLPRTRPITSSSPQPSPRPRPRATAGHSSNEISPTSSCRISPAASFHRSSHSINSTPRKKKPAPPPPPLQTNANHLGSKDEQIENSNEQTKMIDSGNVNLIDSNVIVSDSKENADKKVVSQWKNKKRPAPARPMPLRRPVKEMPLEDIKVELEDIEIRYQELVRQITQLEENIHIKTELESAESSAVEEMVVQLFELVNEKNELFRRRSELVNMRKMYSLEVEQADIEYQIRCLMLRPESNKTDSDKASEEALVKRLVEVVEKRNEIIDIMDKDRLRETVEDQSVTTQLEPKSKKDHRSKEKKKKIKKEKNKEPDDSDKHSPSKLIKQKFMTLRHTAKKLHPKLPD